MSFIFYEYLNGHISGVVHGENTYATSAKQKYAILHWEKDLIAPIKSFNQNTFNRNDIIFDYSN